MYSPEQFWAIKNCFHRERDFVVRIAHFMEVGRARNSGAVSFFALEFFALLLFCAGVFIDVRRPMPSYKLANRTTVVSTQNFHGKSALQVKKRAA